MRIGRFAEARQDLTWTDGVGRGTAVTVCPGGERCGKDGFGSPGCESLGNDRWGQTQNGKAVSDGFVPAASGVVRIVKVWQVRLKGVVNEFKRCWWASPT